MITDIVIIVVVYWVGGTIAGAILGTMVFQGGPRYRKLGARLILTAWAWPAWLAFWLASWLALGIRKLLIAAGWCPKKGPPRGHPADPPSNPCPARTALWDGSSPTTPWTGEKTVSRPSKPKPRTGEEVSPTQSGAIVASMPIPRGARTPKGDCSVSKRCNITITEPNTISQI